MSHTKKIAVIPGDGIGPEVTREAVKVLRATGAPLDFTEFDWGAEKYLREGVTLPDGALTIHKQGVPDQLVPREQIVGKVFLNTR